jgi:hypothetical protein
VEYRTTRNVEPKALSNITSRKPKVGGNILTQHNIVIVTIIALST